MSDFPPQIFVLNVVVDVHCSEKSQLAHLVVTLETTEKGEGGREGDEGDREQGKRINSAATRENKVMDAHVNYIHGYHDIVLYRIQSKLCTYFTNK